MIEPLKRGTKYWTVAQWTAGPKRPEPATWNGDMVDQKRRRNGIVFTSKKNAEEYLAFL